MDTQIVMIESPFAGDEVLHLRYLRDAMRDSLYRGEAPYASHALYTQEGVLDDNNPEERHLGIHAGFAFRRVAAKTIVYGDLGISEGMRQGIQNSLDHGVPVEYRTLPAYYYK